MIPVITNPANRDQTGMVKLIRSLSFDWLEEESSVPQLQEWFRTSSVGSVTLELLTPLSTHQLIGALVRTKLGLQFT